MTTKKFFKSALIVMFGAILVPVFANAQTLNRELELTMTGSDVSILQRFLAKDPTIYPQGLVTGYYGYLTKAAVSNFQSKNGISSVGRVGPATLPVLNYQISIDSMNTNTGSNSNTNTNSNSPTLQAPEISSITINASKNSTNIGWRTNEMAKGIIYYNNKPLVLAEHFNSVDVYGGNAILTDNSFRNEQSINIPNLDSNTTYYYMIYVTDSDGNVSVSMPSTFQTVN